MISMKAVPQSGHVNVTDSSATTPRMNPSRYAPRFRIAMLVDREPAAAERGQLPSLLRRSKAEGARGVTGAGPWSYRDGGRLAVLGVEGFRLREKLTIRPAMAPMPAPMAWPNNNLEVAYRMTSGIWTTAGICAPCGSPPGDVYQDSIGGTRNEATDAPSTAPASMRMSAVFTI